MIRKWVGLLAACVVAALTAGCDHTPPPTEPPPIDPPSTQTVPAEWICVAKADGSQPAPLVIGTRAAWSPDSRRIAFQRAGDVYVIDTDGRNEVRVTPGKSPAWAPDGKRLVYTSREGIAVVNVDGSGGRTLIQHAFRDDTYSAWDMGVDKPAWSPDGALIAFEHLGDGDVQPATVFVMDSSGANPRRPSRSPDRAVYAESDPSWSPDGSRLAYWSFGYGVATNDRDGGVPRTVYSDTPGGVYYGTKPVWSADATALAFNRFDVAAQTRSCSIWFASVTGSGARLFIRDACDAVWSPDGTRIAFTRKRGG